MKGWQIQYSALGKEEDVKLGILAALPQVCYTRVFTIYSIFLMFLLLFGAVSFFKYEYVNSLAPFLYDIHTYTHVRLWVCALSLTKAGFFRICFVTVFTQCT